MKNNSTWIFLILLMFLFLFILFEFIWGIVLSCFCLLCLWFYLEGRNEHITGEFTKEDLRKSYYKGITDDIGHNDPEESFDNWFKKNYG